MEGARKVYRGRRVGQGCCSLILPADTDTKASLCCQPSCDSEDEASSLETKCVELWCLVGAIIQNTRCDMEKYHEN
jgi:hypothetical protein